MSKNSLRTSKLVSEDLEDLHPIISIYVEHSLFEMYITYYNDILVNNILPYLIHINYLLFFDISELKIFFIIKSYFDNPI